MRAKILGRGDSFQNCGVSLLEVLNLLVYSMIASGILLASLWQIGSLLMAAAGNTRAAALHSNKDAWENPGRTACHWKRKALLFLPACWNQSWCWVSAHSISAQETLGKCTRGTPGWSFGRHYGGPGSRIIININSFAASSNDANT